MDTNVPDYESTAVQCEQTVIREVETQTYDVAMTDSAAYKV